MTLRMTLKTNLSFFPLAFFFLCCSDLLQFSFYSFYFLFPPDEDFSIQWMLTFDDDVFEQEMKADYFCYFCYLSMTIFDFAPHPQMATMRDSEEEEEGEQDDDDQDDDDFDHQGCHLARREEISCYFCFSFCSCR